jgi:histone H3/H4
VYALDSDADGGSATGSANFAEQGWGQWEERETMAARKKKAAKRKGKPAELIISKARTKNAVKKCNVGGEFYGALDAATRDLIKAAEARAIGNKRKTLKAVDL